VALGRTFTGIMGKITLLVTGHSYLERKQDKAEVLICAFQSQSIYCPYYMAQTVGKVPATARIGNAAFVS
jgi:hypothetical protein